MTPTESALIDVLSKGLKLKRSAPVLPSTAITRGVPAGTDPSLSARIKMGQSSNVYALVKADGKYYVASKEIKVTLGGCGG